MDLKKAAWLKHSKSEAAQKARADQEAREWRARLERDGDALKRGSEYMAECRRQDEMRNADAWERGSREAFESKALGLSRGCKRGM